MNYYSIGKLAKEEPNNNGLLGIQRPLSLVRIKVINSIPVWDSPTLKKPLMARYRWVHKKEI
jgi:hypothetical protein